ncbi:MAG TPA: DUF1570 domain-containing protein, partial [Pirellulales bacterium]|nr:DUF1570 domain-containing protein [Pirellulales bacterium]
MPVALASCLAIGCAAAGWLAATPAQGANNALNMMIEANVRGTRVEGLPLDWNEQQIHLLARDGYLWEFRPSEAQNLRKTAPSFRSYSFGELRSALDREMAGRLELTATAHYLVAHPRGAGKKWADRFEELYRSFVHYFAVRGLKLKEPDFPLVAIVWPSKQEFTAYARSQGVDVPPGLLGFYSPVTNRIMLYDSSDGKRSSGAWQQDASTIIHEATHQTAFNTNVHSRFAQPPRWLAEGLGMLFEARGVYDSAHYPNASDRVNRDRLASFKQYVAIGRQSGAFLNILESDRMFATDPALAYAEAWALTYFLSETQPKNYNAYLAKTAARQYFASYTAAERLSDFKAAFGKD